MNIQAPTKRIKSKGSAILVHSIFSTIQGEGPFTGRPAIFIRLAGCNLQCPGCDTEYTEGAAQLTIQEIFSRVMATINRSKSAANLVVISGGEPFRQNLTILVDQLHYNGIIVQIETNGTLAPQEEFAKNPVVVCSPKTSKLNPKLLPLITAYKYVLDYQAFDSEDGLPITALSHQATPRLARPHDGFAGAVYLQPMDMTESYPPAQKAAVIAHNAQNTQRCIASCMEHNYTIQLQLHKILGMA